MKILLSPSKTFNLSKPLNQKIHFDKKTMEIFESIKGKSDIELLEIYKKESIIKKVKSYLTTFEDETCYRAIDMYDGMVYKHIDYNNLDNLSKEFIEENVLILSAFYGIVKPKTLIKPYRLDFQSKLKINGKSLKKYWKDYYEKYIDKNDIIINLASNEFTELFNRKMYRWYDFDFFDETFGVKKRHSTISKKNRGKLLNEISRKQLSSIEEIEKLKSNGELFSIIR